MLVIQEAHNGKESWLHWLDAGCWMAVFIGRTWVLHDGELESKGVREDSAIHS